MMRVMVDGIEVIGDITEDEAREYAKRAPKGCTRIKAQADGHYVNLWYYERVPFERIRRITGYLVGTLDRFNDAKRAEVAERVTHG